MQRRRAGGFGLRAVAGVGLATALALVAPSGAAAVPPERSTGSTTTAPARPVPIPPPATPGDDEEWCLPVEVEDANVRRFFGVTWLVVSGTTPYRHMTVRAEPVTYVQRPAYWRWEIEGCLQGIGLPALGEFRTTIRLGDAIGTRGVEVGGVTVDVRNRRR